MPSPGPELTDGVVVLTPMTLGDAEDHLAGEDIELVRWLNGGPGSTASVERYLRSVEEQWSRGGPKLGFGIRTRRGRHLVGTLDVDFGLPDLPPRYANLAYGLYPAWRGQGLATRAVRLGCRYLRGRGDIDKAVIRADARNAASVAVAARAGFVSVEARSGPGADSRITVWEQDVRT